jgi:hypothetical protein
MTRSLEVVEPKFIVIAVLEGYWELEGDALVVIICLVVPIAKGASIAVIFKGTCACTTGAIAPNNPIVPANVTPRLQQDLIRKLKVKLVAVLELSFACVMGRNLEE